MCGICGALEPATRDGEGLRARVLRMSGTMEHRGPDAHGQWHDAAHGVALGHRRLSIIDLSENGSQPMATADGRYTIVFNGEIYNYRALRAALPTGAAFRGDSDTEVLLAAIAEWGIDGALRALNGMFAFAVWDAAHHELTLARDRMGEKPLYYGWSGNAFLFGSELKALAAHPAFRGGIDRGALGLYLRHGYIPAPFTIYPGVHKLPAGTRLTLRAADAPGTTPAPVAYWTLPSRDGDGAAAPTDAEAIDGLESLLADAVAIRMIADVPLGAFLSGGIDSSTVVALMQRAASGPVRTFSIGFAEQEHDEAPFARAIAAHLGTDHTELRVTPGMAMELIPRLASIYDEPFGDSSAIPTTLLSTLTRAHVTVALSGDGGDELFGGYGRYARAERAWRLRNAVPSPVRGAAAFALRHAARGRSGSRVGRMSRLLASSHALEQYGAMTTYWDAADLLGTAPHPTLLTDIRRWPRFADTTQGLMYADALMYLPDDILVKVDRASMSASLEARVPLLDHRVVEHAWQLPRHLRVRNGQRKWILRQVLARHVPPALFERPKTGFRVPIDAWLRGPLRGWAEDLLDASRLAAGGLLDPRPIRARWAAHLAGENHADHLWIVLMFQAWHAQHAQDMPHAPHAGTAGARG